MIRDDKMHVERFKYDDDNMYTGRVENRFLMASFYADNWNEFFYSKREVIDYIKNNPDKFKNTFIVATNLSFDFFGTFFKEPEMVHFDTLFRGSSLITAETFLHEGEFRRKLPKEIKTRIKLTFIDTLNYAQVGVEKAGRIIGFPKLETPDNLGLKPKSDEEWATMEKYNLRDSEVSKKFIVLQKVFYR